MVTEIRIASTGGQGVILASIVLAEAAGVYEGRRVVQTQSYGPEARGGASRADVIIADEPTAHLDSGCARSFLDLVGDFLSRGRSAIVASHDPSVCESDLFNQRFHLQCGHVVC